MSQLRTASLAPGVAFITGGARGLGNAIAQAFAKEGSRGICIVDIQDEKTFAEGKAAIEALGTHAKVINIHADITKEDEVEAAVAKAVKEFGRIDYAANFADIIGPIASMWDCDSEKYRKVIDINCNGVWLSTKYEMKQMMKQDPIGGIEAHRVQQRGSIINAASVNSIQAGAGTSAYAAAKHAVVGITKTAALEARAHNIRVNAVSPGFLRTRLLETVVQGSAGSGEEADQLWGHFEARQGRGATLDEVGDVVVALSTPRFSLVNGVNLPIDG